MVLQDFLYENIHSIQYLHNFNVYWLNAILSRKKGKKEMDYKYKTDI